MADEWVIVGEPERAEAWAEGLAKNITVRDPFDRRANLNKRKLVALLTPWFASALAAGRSTVRS